MAVSIDALFENENVILVDKPAGYLSVPSRMGVADPRPVVGILLQEQLGQTLFPVHRLDEETSGLLLFAKNSSAQRTLNRSFELHTVQKTYQAISEFKESYEALVGSVLKNKLFRGKKRSFEAPHGQSAETKVLAAEAYQQKYLIWSLQPFTGRSHQLRVQLAMRGFPILGDRLYGSTLSFPEHLPLPTSSLRGSAIGLRAVALEFSNSDEMAGLGMPARLETCLWSLKGI